MHQQLSGIHQCGFWNVNQQFVPPQDRADADRGRERERQGGEHRGLSEGSDTQAAASCEPGARCTRAAPRAPSFTAQNLHKLSTFCPIQILTLPVPFCRVLMFLTNLCYFSNIFVLAPLQRQHEKCPFPPLNSQKLQQRQNCVHLDK